MQEKTINNALLALRRQIIRGDGENLAHVEALLRARGVEPPRHARPEPVGNDGSETAQGRIETKGG